MLVLTVQRRRNLEAIYRGSYHPSLWMSKFAFTSERYTTGYKYILKLLSRKTKRQQSGTLDSCLWGWVINPFLDFYREEYAKNLNASLDKRYCAVFVEVPDDKLILSDYDLWNEYISEVSDDFIRCVKNISGKGCIQASFWDIEPESIRCVCDLKWLFNKKDMSVRSLMNLGLLHDERYKFDVFLSGDAEDFLLPLKVS